MPRVLIDQGSAQSKKSTNVRLKKAGTKAFTMGLSLAHAVAPQKVRGLVQAKFFAPKVLPLTHDQQNLLDRAERFKVQVNGYDLAAWRWGQGPAVLLVHGWDSRGVHLGGFVEPFLEAGWSVITYDAPAHGLSQGVWTHYFDFIDALRGVLASQAGADVRAVAAHSLGGGAAIAALSKYAPEPRLPAVLLAPSLKLKEVLQYTFRHYGVPEALFMGFIKDLEIKHGYRMEKDNPWELALKAENDFLLIHDEKDPTISLKHTRRLAEANSALTLETTQGLGHNRIISDAKVIDTAVQYLTRTVRA